jgi:hypothetical protein
VLQLDSRDRRIRDEFSETQNSRFSKPGFLDENPLLQEPAVSLGLGVPIGVNSVVSGGGSSGPRVFFSATDVHLLCSIAPRASRQISGHENFMNIGDECVCEKTLAHGCMDR